MKKNQDTGAAKRAVARKRQATAQPRSMPAARQLLRHAMGRFFRELERAIRASRLRAHALRQKPADPHLH